jgi:orf6 protein|nr:MAG TPA: hypothetical protein [Caudoviricetes sp.]
MKLLSKSEKPIILFDDFVLQVYQGFIKKLLKTQQTKNKSGYYFKTSSNLPKNELYIKSFLKFNYAYEDFDYILKLYRFIIDEVDKISLNAFYNLILYLSDNQIYQLDSNQLYDILELSKNLINDLENNSSIINTTNFLKSLQKNEE